MKEEIKAYHDAQSDEDKTIMDTLHDEICKGLPEAENKIWHRHPVWFLDDNPIVGYSKLKGCVRMMFWSGMSFDEADLKAGTGKFKDASIRFTAPDQINTTNLQHWLEKARDIQWDYKNIYKTKGVLVRLK